MKIDEKTRATLSRVSGATGINVANLEKELQLMSLAPKVFEAIEKLELKAALFGGTALNKGYYAEKQRFSKDLDIDLFVPSLIKVKDRLEKEFAKIKGYKVKLEHSSKETIVWSFSYGPEPWENLLVEIRKPALDEKTRDLELHSILEYHGVPVFPINVQAYTFEYNFARKIIALSRRAVGKDIYDTYIGLLLEPDIELIGKHIKRISKSSAKEIASEAIYCLEKVKHDSPDIIELNETVPLAYRAALAQMIQEVIHGLKRL